ncbi:hypothetical protein OPT61_g8117 [Boeremia exigua]|uniref:Uncharacterized protein n=1 Tax=Boeremia exigua TaxID=749465 RepID=A0ACC2HZN1_9PLEO|nr:hypothetical protein OPT61_g8117 [Boeremia exigua]
MSADDDLAIAELEAQMQLLHADSDARLANCDKLVARIDARQKKDKERFVKVEKLLAEQKVAIIAPHILFAAQKLPDAILKLKVTEYDLQRKTDEYKRLEAKQLDARKSEIRVKKENRQLAKSMESLSAQLKGDCTPEDMRLKTENEMLKKELAMMKTQLKDKTDECEMKDRDINDLREDFAAYQSVTSSTWAHRHDACNELVAVLEEQCSTLTQQRDALESNLNTLHHKINTLTIERDSLQNQFTDAIKAHKMELEDYDSLKCQGSSSCTSCVLHLERSLRISRAAESQALQLVDQVNHDRMVAWNQLHEHQTRAVQEHYVAVGTWVSSQRAPSMSPTLVSPTYKPDGDNNDGWKFPNASSLSESGSVEFVL